MHAPMLPPLTHLLLRTPLPEDTLLHAPLNLPHACLLCCFCLPAALPAASSPH
jgi:hypothetical protein